MNLFKIIAKGINEYVEDTKEKEYIVFYNSNMINGRYDCYEFTKKQLIKFIKEHETKKITVFKIKDEVKITKEIKIEMKEDD